MAAVLLALLSFAQDPDWEEILDGLATEESGPRFFERLRALPGADLAVARRIVESSGRGTDRRWVEYLGSTEDPVAMTYLNGILRDSSISTARRLDLAEALNDVRGIDRTTPLGEIAAGEAPLPERLRAVVALAREDRSRARALTPEILQELPLEMIGSEEVRNRVAGLARAGDPGARALLARAAESESLPPEARLAATASLEKDVRLAALGRLCLSLFLQGSAERGSAPAPASVRFDPPKESVSAAEPAAKVVAPVRFATSDSEKASEEGGSMKKNLVILAVVVAVGAGMMLSGRRTA